MSDTDGKSTRDERLAASLRENLKRRKAQARALAGTAPSASESPTPAGGTLPKTEDDR